MTYAVPDTCMAELIGLVCTGHAHIKAQGLILTSSWCYFHLLCHAWKILVVWISELLTGISSLMEFAKPHSV